MGVLSEARWNRADSPGRAGGAPLADNARLDTDCEIFLSIGFRMNRTGPQPNDPMAPVYGRELRLESIVDEQHRLRAAGWADESGVAISPEQLSVIGSARRQKIGRAHV